MHTRTCLVNGSSEAFHDVVGLETGGHAHICGVGAA